MHRADRRRAEESAGPAHRAPPRARGAGARPRGPCARGRGARSPRGSASTAASSGPLSDFVTTDREDAELAERLLGDWMHAVLVRDDGDGARGAGLARGAAAGRAGAAPARSRTAAAERRPARWTTGSAAEGPGCGLGARGARGLRGARRRRAASSAAPAAPSSSRGAGAPSGPLRRRAELADLAQEVERAGTAVAAAEAALRGDHRRGWPSGSAR